jgi:RNA 2',3'-cyclic 3'-phosphodiesterase
MALRCFIAIEIPEAIRGAIVGSIDSLKESGADVKWVSPENIHITLQFLGETEETRIPLIKKALNKILLTYSPFYIKIAGVGCFPDARRPRVIWVGTEGSQPVINLHGDIARGMAGLVYLEEERSFTPHLTIGRVKSNRNVRELLSKIDEIKEVRFSDFEVRNITLMKSELRPSGPIYSSLAEIPFGGRSNGN